MFTLVMKTFWMLSKRLAYFGWKGMRKGSTRDYMQVSGKLEPKWREFQLENTDMKVKNVWSTWLKDSHSIRKIMETI